MLIFCILFFCLIFPVFGVFFLLCILLRILLRFRRLLHFRFLDLLIFLHTAFQLFLLFFRLIDLRTFLCIECIQIDHSLIDQPQDPRYSVRKIEREMAWFKGNFILQTMFLRGVKDGKCFDCTDRRHAGAWVRMALRLHPREVMMYTLDRVPPLLTLEKVSVEEMQEIARPLVDAGILVQIKG